MKTQSWIISLFSRANDSRWAIVFVLAGLLAFAIPVRSQDKGDAVDDGYRVGQSVDDLEKSGAKRSISRSDVKSTPDSVMPPSNDNFANASSFGGSGGWAQSNVGATSEPGEPSHGAGHGSLLPGQNNSLWYKYTATYDGVMSASAGCGTGADAMGDSVISVYIGTAVNNLTAIGENDDMVDSLCSRVVFAVQTGQTYYIAVDGYMSATGSFGFGHYIYFPAYWSDNFTNPEDLGGGIRSPYIGVTGSNQGATGQPGEPDHNGESLPLNSIWYKWTPTTSGAYTFTSQGSTFDTILAAYLRVGDAPGPEVGSNDDFGGVGVRSSRMTFYAEAGQTYLIAIDGYGVQNDFGNTLLNWYPNREEAGKRFDLDGDVKTDVSIFRPSNGQWWVKRSSGGHYALAFGNGADKPTPADFTGDGKVDIAFWRPSTGYWYILRSEDNSFYAFPFGTFGDIPATGRFDNDAKADPVVYRPSTGVWYIAQSRTSSVAVQGFGIPGDVPVVADYDGDGRSDIAIFRPSNGQWWINRSRQGIATTTFGTATDIPVPGAYNGQGYSNIAFWRPSTGEWFVLINPATPNYYAFPFGVSTDIPAPGDYDGDGKFDAAVFRPSSATWYVNRSGGGGNSIEQFGTPGDIPLPSSYIP